MNLGPVFSTFFLFYFSRTRTNVQLCPPPPSPSSPQARRTRVPPSSTWPNQTQFSSCYPSNSAKAKPEAFPVSQEVFPGPWDLENRARNSSSNNAITNSLLSHHLIPRLISGPEVARLCPFPVASKPETLTRCQRLVATMEGSRFRKFRTQTAKKTTMTKLSTFRNYHVDAWTFRNYPVDVPNHCSGDHCSPK